MGKTFTGGKTLGIMDWVHKVDASDRDVLQQLLNVYPTAVENITQTIGRGDPATQEPFTVEKIKALIQQGLADMMAHAPSDLQRRKAVSTLMGTPPTQQARKVYEAFIATGCDPAEAARLTQKFMDAANPSPKTWRVEDFENGANHDDLRRALLTMLQVTTYTVAVLSDPVILLLKKSPDFLVLWNKRTTLRAVKTPSRVDLTRFLPLPDGLPFSLADLCAAQWDVLLTNGLSMLHAVTGTLLRVERGLFASPKKMGILDSTQRHQIMNRHIVEKVWGGFDLWPYVAHALRERGVAYGHELNAETDTRVLSWSVPLLNLPTQTFSGYLKHANQMLIDAVTAGVQNTGKDRQLSGNELRHHGIRALALLDGASIDVRKRGVPSFLPDGLLHPVNPDHLPMNDSLDDDAPTPIADTKPPPTSDYEDF